MTDFDRLLLVVYKRVRKLNAFVQSTLLRHHTKIQKLKASLAMRGGYHKLAASSDEDLPANLTEVVKTLKYQFVRQLIVVVLPLDVRAMLPDIEMDFQHA